MIKLGSEVKDSITGFSGIAMARVEYLNGCIQYEVKPKKLDKNRKMLDSEWIDEEQLISKPEAKRGGPHNIPTGFNKP